MKQIINEMKSLERNEASDRDKLHIGSFIRLTEVEKLKVWSEFTKTGEAK